MTEVSRGVQQMFKMMASFSLNTRLISTDQRLCRSRSVEQMT